jgi:hypothetical protein
MSKSKKNQSIFFLSIKFKPNVKARHIDDLVPQKYSDKELFDIIDGFESFFNLSDKMINLSNEKKTMAKIQKLYLLFDEANKLDDHKKLLIQNSYITALMAERLKRLRIIDFTQEPKIEDLFVPHEDFIKILTNGRGIRLENTLKELFEHIIELKNANPLSQAAAC